MSQIKIRPAIAGDLPFFKDVETSAATAFSVLPNYIPNERTVPPELLQEMFLAKKLWVAANGEDNPIGFIGCRDMDGLFYIHEISVAREFQKQGIGRRLMTTALNEAIASGYPAAGLTTSQNVPWNMPFYETLGFVELTDNKRWTALSSQLQKEIAEGADPAARCAMIKNLERQ